MEITRTSILSNIKRTKELNVTARQLRSWRNGMLIQDAFPHLTDDEREFIKTGITPDEWNTILGPSDDGIE